MTNFIYYIFFISLNLFIFLILSKRFLLNRYVNLSIAIFFIILYLTHQLNSFVNQINSSDFRKICFFSFTLIFWFYLNSLFLKQIETKKDSLNYFNKWIYVFVKRRFLIYLIFIMTTITQIDWVSRIN